MDLTLVHVLPDPFAVPYTPSEIAVLTHAARVTEQLEKLAAQLQNDGIPAHAVVREGVVQVGVVTQAERSHAELIVLPTHRPQAHHWISRDGGGEHADLLDHSPVPILMIQENTAALTELHKIIVPLDGSPSGDSILPYVAKLAATADACVVLVHVLGSHERGSAQAVQQHLNTIAELPAV
jgi:nucleotide-binding universal stress UspA family protein